MPGPGLAKLFQGDLRRRNPERIGNVHAMRRPLVPITVPVLAHGKQAGRDGGEFDAERIRGELRTGSRKSRQHSGGKNRSVPEAGIEDPFHGLGTTFSGISAGCNFDKEPADDSQTLISPAPRFAQSEYGINLTFISFIGAA